MLASKHEHIWLQYKTDGPAASNYKKHITTCIIYLLTFNVSSFETLSSGWSYDNGNISALCGICTGISVSSTGVSTCVVGIVEDCPKTMSVSLHVVLLQHGKSGFVILSWVKLRTRFILTRFLVPSNYTIFCNINIMKSTFVVWSHVMLVVTF